MKTKDKIAKIKSHMEHLKQKIEDTNSRIEKMTKLKLSLEKTLCDVVTATISNLEETENKISSECTEKTVEKSQEEKTIKEKVIDIIDNGVYFTTKRVARQVGCTTRSVNYAISKLRNEGLVVKVGIGVYQWIGQQVSDFDKEGIIAVLQPGALSLLGYLKDRDSLDCGWVAVKEINELLSFIPLHQIVDLLENLYSHNLVKKTEAGKKIEDTVYRITERGKQIASDD